MSRGWLSTIALGCALVLCGCETILGIDDPIRRLDGEGGAGATGGGCRALRFDGTDDFVNVEDDPALDQLDRITIEAWVYAESYPTEVQILSHHTHSSNTGYVLLIFQTARLQFRYQFGGTNHPTGNADVPAGGWHHVAASYDGSVARIFVDGALQSASTIGPGTTEDFDGPLTIGATATKDRFFFHGAMDEVRLSRVARYTSDFILDTKPFVADGDTVALWHFDGDGQDVPDATGNHPGILGRIPAPDEADPARIRVPCIYELPGSTQLTGG